MIEKLLQYSVTHNQVNSNTFSTSRLHSRWEDVNVNLVNTPNRLFHKEYKSYAKLIEIFSTCRNLHIVKDYLVCQGLILDMSLNYLVVVNKQPNAIRSFNGEFLPNYFDVYIAKEVFSDKAFMKNFLEIFQSGLDFNYIIMSKEELNNFIPKRDNISTDLIPLPYEQQEQEEGA